MNLGAQPELFLMAYQEGLQDLPASGQGAASQGAAIPGSAWCSMGPFLTSPMAVLDRSSELSLSSITTQSPAFCPRPLSQATGAGLAWKWRRVNRPVGVAGRSCAVSHPVQWAILEAS